ncbi:unnamed protein product [Aphanomyces euteiches]|uniref:NADH-ubiquinone oxidoreductase 21kDa subunit N-terminal domain-containing protein n=1 Tax=Aphanomyces euteiches TaxID=100861 RepID=A0A6G0WJZ9_9STRA|nr:hypothetical protein Ae201684_014399 [Aphanomyces euteiches]KAH9088899.1 hypothetical protein Ae201684P_013112 [Aphanomyces euteiches]KAH9158187.1 hypothetical protein AeRB84_000020 [Aphanomyces euteiches]
MAPHVDPREPKYPVKMKYPSFNDTTDNFNASDYLTIAAFTAVSVAVGFASGKPVRVPAAVTTGILGYAGGYLYAFENSASRLQGYKE